jgi:hypothetical protein
MSYRFEINYRKTETICRNVCDGIVSRASFQDTHVVSVAGLGDVRIRTRLRPSSAREFAFVFLYWPRVFPQRLVRPQTDGEADLA